MEHHPDAVLAIGEVALFLIGTLLSIILLAILLLPSLMKFRVPHWVKIKRTQSVSPIKAAPNDREHPFDKVIPKLIKHGYQVLTREDSFMVITKDSATRYHLYLHSSESINDEFESIAMFRQGDETMRSDPTSILAGAGIAWIVILCHQALSSRGCQPQWGWDAEFRKTNGRPFSAVMEQVILLNPWR